MHFILKRGLSGAFSFYAPDTSTESNIFHKKGFTVQSYLILIFTHYHTVAGT